MTSRKGPSVGNKALLHQMLKYSIETLFPEVGNYFLIAYRGIKILWTVNQLCKPIPFFIVRNKVVGEIDHFLYLSEVSLKNIHISIEKRFPCSKYFCANNFS